MRLHYTAHHHQHNPSTWTIHCEWGTIPTKYSTEQAANFAIEVFSANPKLYWPIVFDYRIYRSTRTEEVNGRDFWHNEIMLFLPNWQYLPWNLKVPGLIYPQLNLFSTTTSAYETSTKIGEYSSERIARRYRPAKRR